MSKATLRTYTKNITTGGVGEVLSETPGTNISSSDFIIQNDSAEVMLIGDSSSQDFEIPSGDSLSISDVARAGSEANFNSEDIFIQAATTSSKYNILYTELVA